MNLYIIRMIYDRELITAITLEIMNALPKWFSPPEDIVNKSIAHQQMPVFSAFDGERAVGFIALKAHNQFTVEMYNLGVLEAYHHRGIGNAMMQAVEQYCKESDYKFITVKTLDSSAQYEPYERTRSSYIKNGFCFLRFSKHIGMRKIHACIWLSILGYNNLSHKEHGCNCMSYRHGGIYV